MWKTWIPSDIFEILADLLTFSQFVRVVTVTFQNALIQKAAVWGGQGQPREPFGSFMELKKGFAYFQTNPLRKEIHQHPSVPTWFLCSPLPGLEGSCLRINCGAREGSSSACYCGGGRSFRCVVHCARSCWLQHGKHESLRINLAAVSQSRTLWSAWECTHTHTHTMPFLIESKM